MPSKRRRASSLPPNVDNLQLDAIDKRTSHAHLVIHGDPVVRRSSGRGRCAFRRSPASAATRPIAVVANVDLLGFELFNAYAWHCPRWQSALATDHTDPLRRNAAGPRLLL